MNMPLIYRSFITRRQVQLFKNVLFVFGDNLERKGFGGQAAEMRNEPNSVGIPTKRKPSRNSDAYFSDEDFEEVKPIIKKEMFRLVQHLKNNKIVVWPEDGIGTGRANLANSSQKIWNYIEQWRLKLEKDY